MAIIIMTGTKVMSSRPLFLFLKLRIQNIKTVIKLIIKRAFKKFKLMPLTIIIWLLKSK
jgi:hypothetical protein